MNKIVIFGAGEWGKYALSYYGNTNQVQCFVDNDKQLWGNERHGLVVLNPCILKQLGDEVIVIVANREHGQEIKKQIVEEYGIKKVVTFQICIKVEPEYIDKISEEREADELIIPYVGGLGNQMFLYAFSRYLVKNGKNVTADFSFYADPYSNTHGLLITDVFKNISLRLCNFKNKSYYDNAKDEMVFCEPENEIGSKFVIEQINKYDKGIISGYFQSAEIVNSVKDELYRDFCFENTFEIQNLIKKIGMRNSVSVHVRRGDYLDNINKHLNVCDIDYFMRAMKYMRNVVPEITWVFFSDDIEWVKEKLYCENAIYISKDDFIEYKDWYDMYIMSQCSHHIISNSTFSWWGAWLARNPNKIVIAPKIWSRKVHFPNICPQTWIRI